MNHYHIGDEIVYEPIERESSFTVKAQHYCWRCRPKQDCFSIIRCKSAKYKSWEVLIIIEENKFKEMVFTGRFEWCRIGLGLWSRFKLWRLRKELGWD
jgi:hypothetical protein